MHEGGITNYGEKNLAPFSVIKDLDIPRCKDIKIGAGEGVPIHKNVPASLNEGRETSPVAGAPEVGVTGTPWSDFVMPLIPIP